MPRATKAATKKKSVGRGAQNLPVTKDRIIDTALRLVEAGGLGALSMRKLAAELGVAPTAIYWHVGDRATLLAELINRIASDVVSVKASGKTPAQRVASVVRGIRKQVQAHPHLIALARQIGEGPAVNFPAQVVLAREVSAAGLKGENAAMAVRSLLYFVGGFVLLEGNLRETGSSSGTPALWRKVDAADIDGGLVAAMRRQPNLEQLFEHTLTRLVDSVLGS